MISELKEKINSLNKVVDHYQQGEYSEGQFKKALSEKTEEVFSKETSEPYPCRNPHNNGEDESDCIERVLLFYLVIAL